MKALFVLALTSINVFAAPLTGTCTSNFADCVGPKLNTGSRITKRCELPQYRTIYVAYEYTEGRESGTAIVSAGSSSAVSDVIMRTTYPGSSVGAALVQELVDNGGMTESEAKAELKKATCVNIANEVVR